MPELPEVETVRRGLDRSVRGRSVVASTLTRRDLRWPIPVRAVRGLTGRRLTHVDRRSKYLLLHFSGDAAPVALVHLGMSGRLWVDPVRRRQRRPAFELHEHWRVDFGDRCMRFVDPRRFGCLDIVTTPRLHHHRLLADLGPEPFAAEFNADAVYADTRRRRVACKTYLMDARRVVGVGNIYASEACFRAGLRPGRGVHRTSRADCARLVDAVRSVLRDAIRQGGTTLRDYTGVDRNAGEFQQQLSVYGRAGEPCDHCGTPITAITQHGRSSYYCPHCQY